MGHGPYYQSFLKRYLKDDPELLTVFGLTERGVRSTAGLLSEASDGFVLERIARAGGHLNELLVMGVGEESSDDALSREILSWYLSCVTEAGPYCRHSYPVQSSGGISDVFLSGVPEQTLSLLLYGHPLHNRQDAVDYVSRLYAVRAKFGQLEAALKERRRRGLSAPRLVLLDAILRMRCLVDVAPERHILYVHFEQRLRTGSTLDDRELASLLGTVRVAIQESVVPAYESLMQACIDEADNGSQECSLARRPDGDGYYRHLLKRATTLDSSPEEMHRVGLEEIQRVSQEMAEMLATLGCNDALPFASWQRLKGAPSAKRESASVVREAMLCISSVESYLSRIIVKKLAHPVRVQPMNPHMAEVAGEGYYEHPSCLTEGHGVFHINTQQMEDLSGLKTLTVHETIPGHHLQYVYLYGEDPLPTFRSVLPFPAYTEGWALYAERLMHELGFYDDDPLSSLALLEAQLRRSARLVLDTGIHCHGWSTEEAWRRLQDLIGEADWAKAEIKRACIQPATGCAYKIGELELMKMRQRERNRLGANFDLRAFHHELLSCGPCPLQILGRRVANRMESEPSSLSTAQPIRTSRAASHRQAPRLAP